MTLGRATLRRGARASHATVNIVNIRIEPRPRSRARRGVTLCDLSRHCEERSDEAIQRQQRTGLLRFARNDGK